MNTSRKRIVSLFLILVLILSFSSQTQATAESRVLTQKLLAESAVSELLLDTDSMPDPKLDEVCLGASGQEEEPRPEPDIKPDPNADEVTLGASGQETPTSGPTITPFRIGDFIVGGKVGKQYFVNETEIVFAYNDSEYRAPYRYTYAQQVPTELVYSDINAVNFKIPITQTEGIKEFKLEAALADLVIETAPKEDWAKWDYDNGRIFVLIQRVESFTTVTGSTNPTAINVGRESVNDAYSGEPTKPPTFLWEITKDGTVILSGTDTQPDMYEVDYLPAGDYTVTTTATEFFPMGYEDIDDNGDSVSDTTTANFKVTVGDVIVEHRDADTNDIIHAPTTITGTFKGDDYATSPKTISGYLLKTTPSNNTGVFTDTDQTVTYIYEKAITQVIVEHVYEDGTPIILPVKLLGRLAPQ